MKLSECTKVANSVILEAHDERQRRLDSLRQRQEKRLIKDVFYHWRKLAHKKRRAKQVLDNFPSSVGDQGLVQRNVFSNSTLTQSLNKVQSTNKLFEALEVEDKLTEEILVRPFDLVGMLGPILAEKWPKKNEIFWKCILSIPDTQTQMENVSFVQVARRKFRTIYSPVDPTRIT